MVAVTTDYGSVKGPRACKLYTVKPAEISKFSSLKKWFGFRSETLFSKVLTKKTQLTAVLFIVLAVLT